MGNMDLHTLCIKKSAIAVRQDEEEELVKKKIGTILAAVGFLMIAAAVDTYSKGNMNTMQFALQMMASVDALIASYILGDNETWDA